MKLLHFDKSWEYAGLAVALVIFAPLMWMAADREPPIIIRGHQGPAQPVDHGASLKPSYDGEWLRRCSGSSQRVFVDAAHVIYRVDPYEFRDGIGADGRPITLRRRALLPPVRAPVPTGAATGPATYQAITNFYCNPLQKMFGKRWPDLFSITFRYPVVDFTIGPGLVTKIEPPTSAFAPVPPDGDEREILSDEVPPPPREPNGVRP